MKRASLLVALLFAFVSTAHSQPLPNYPPPAEVRAAFLKLLDRPKVPLDPKLHEARLDTDDLLTERLSIASEKLADGRFERVPILIVRPGKGGGRRPAVIVLHGTGGTKEQMLTWLTGFAKEGFVGVAIDARHHGERVGVKSGAAAYNEAIARAWRIPSGQKQEYPFYYDTCWDLWRTIDFLVTRNEVDPKRIGMMGISMGGIETWLAAAVDERVRAAVPLIGVQSFQWSLENERWQARANTIKAAHAAAAKDLGAKEVNADVCRKLWNKVIPGMLDQFDCPSMLRLFAGRPLLILNGEKDPNCPIEGARIAFRSAGSAYANAKTSDMLKMLVASGVAHTVTKEHAQEARDWFAKWLR
jgi:dienelactone hydrolase